MSKIEKHQLINNYNLCSTPHYGIRKMALKNLCDAALNSEDVQL